MSIDMDLSASRAQASSFKRMAAQKKQGYDEMERAINQFALNSPMLTGAAYDAAKRHYTNVLIPLVKGGRLLTEAAERAVQKFPEEYVSQVDSVSLKESKLTEQINRLQKQIEAKKAQQSQLRQLTSQLPSEERGSARKAQQGLSNSIAALEKAKKKLEKKREKLRAFHRSSPAIFSEIAALEAAINKGAIVSANAWNGSTFVTPLASDMEWANTINESWENYQKEQARDQLDGYDIIRVVNADGSVEWILSKAGKWLSRQENTTAYSALDSIVNELKEKDYKTYKVIRDEVTMLPGFGSLGSIGKVGKGVLDIAKGVNFLETIKDINIMLSKKTDSEFEQNIKDGLPAKKHKIFDSDDADSLRGDGEPNSSADLLNPDGSVKQRRYYGPDGKALEDVDFNHSDDGTHEFPHRHKWDWNKRPPRQKGEW